MNKDNLYVISFEKIYNENCFSEMIVLFNINVISEKAVREIIKQGSFVYDHCPSIVVMTKEQYDNLCK